MPLIDYMPIDGKFGAYYLIPRVKRVLRTRYPVYQKFSGKFWIV